VPCSTQKTGKNAIFANNRKQLLNYVKNGLNQHDAIFRYLGADGTLRWAKVIFKLELNPVTGDYEALGHTIDISKAAEEDAILNSSFRTIF
jgi:hypothetical protein